MRNAHHRDRRALLLLLASSALLLLLGLGTRELWGPETRWANIALQMLQSGNYFDPTLMGHAYYDKPLPSYWLITASSWLTGGLGHWSLRLSSVLAAWLSVWLVYLLGEQLFRRGTGRVAGWLLATTFYFVFWARVATADILTLCGVLAAVWWYWRGPDDTRLSRYCVFCLLLAVTSLFKGLIGFILPGLLLLPHLLSKGRWRRHLNLRLCAAVLLAALIYAVPFWLSHVYGAPTYQQSGMELVFRENVVRYFQPFDQFGPIYTYLIYLPVYTLPWAPFWLLGLWVALRNWRTLEPNARWLVLGLGWLFLFFTASGSRRSYYVLPLVPFAQLLAAWWITRRWSLQANAGDVKGKGLRIGIVTTTALLLLVLGVIAPWSNLGGGVTQFGEEVRQQASRIAPWAQWRMVMIDVDNKVPLALQNHGAPFYYVDAGQDYPREGSSAQLIAWLEKTSGLALDPQRTVIVTQMRRDQPLPLGYLGADHEIVVSRPDNGERLLSPRKEGTVAFIPGGQ